MYARIVFTEIVPETVAEFAAAWKEVIGGTPPAGWVQAYLIHDPSTNQIVGLSLWESEAHSAEYEASGRFREDAMKLARYRSDDRSQPPKHQEGSVIAQVKR